MSGWMKSGEVSMDSILLDTSFCIRLLKSNDPLHQNAKDYFKYFLEKKVEMYLSTIVVAEYSVKDSAKNLPLEFVKIIPFDFFDGKTAGEFHSILISNKERVSTLERNVIKDDCKLIAQIHNRGIQGYITKDKRSFGSIIRPITTARGFNIKLLDLETPLSAFSGELF
jgi:predicted nucleic acid-binding protein